MATVDIDAFKSDLDLLKSQRSVIQVKLDQATNHLAELQATLKGMGFDTIEQAKQAYVNQISQAEAQHQLVKDLIAEINLVDSKCPTKEEIAARLNELSMTELNPTVTVEAPIMQSEVINQNDTVVSQEVLDKTLVQEPKEAVGQILQESSTESVAEPKSSLDEAILGDVLGNKTESNVADDLDLGGLLFANL